MPYHRRLALSRAIAITACLLTGLVGCSSSGSSGVQWDDYAPGTRARIDALAAARDCLALQAEFDQAEANGAATRARTGHNSAELMRYVDEAMRSAGCY